MDLVTILTVLLLCLSFYEIGRKEGGTLSKKEIQSLKTNNEEFRQERNNYLQERAGLLGEKDTLEAENKKLRDNLVASEKRFNELQSIISKKSKQIQVAFREFPERYKVILKSSLPYPVQAQIDINVPLDGSRDHCNLVTNRNKKDAIFDIIRFLVED